MRRRAFLSRLTGAALASGAAPRPRAQPVTRIRVATGVTPPSIHNIFLHVAYERDLFRVNGLEVTEFLQLHGGPLAMQAIAAAQVDVAPADPEGLLAARSSGHQLRAVAAPGARLSYMLAVRREVRTLADLRDRPFAISRAGAISQYLMFPLLDAEGIPRESVRWVGIGSARDRLLALQAGRVHGTLLHVDFAMEAANDGNLRLLRSIADVLPEYPVELLVLRKEMLAGNPDAAAGIVRAVIQACRYIVANKAGTLDVVRRYAPGMDHGVLGRAWDELLRIRGFGVNGGMTETNMRIAHDLALQNRQIARPIPLDEWADFRFQARALAELGRVPG
ncbi:MAG TPA: ABC transporter substrate-binding protein [Methylomirabilota bacterium]|jgi:ABC-type nitrate/sulfonate/bicarbonate transport system substrate-binding protein|nr:ABC transporter substrate-binding protein [Methylomirabilota bacterium]